MRSTECGGKRVAKSASAAREPADLAAAAAASAAAAVRQKAHTRSKKGQAKTDEAEGVRGHKVARREVATGLNHGTEREIELRPAHWERTRRPLGGA